MYNNLCFPSCPAQAPFSVSSVCKQCNVVSCYECSGTDCAQCDSGFLLIGSTLCISSCGDQAVYNAATKQCDVVETPGTNTN